jgi:hypothetical protein
VVEIFTHHHTVLVIGSYKSTSILSPSLSLSLPYHTNSIILSTNNSMLLEKVQHQRVRIPSMHCGVGVGDVGRRSSKQQHTIPYYYPISLYFMMLGAV